MIGGWRGALGVGGGLGTCGLVEEGLGGVEAALVVDHPGVAVGVCAQRRLRGGVGLPRCCAVPCATPGGAVHDVSPRSRVVGGAAAAHM